jgi:hypothetical protein
LLSPHYDPAISRPFFLQSPSPGVTTVDLVDSSRALAWFAAEHQVLLAAAQQATANGHHRQADLLDRALMTYLHYGRGQ